MAYLLVYLACLLSLFAAMMSVLVFLDRQIMRLHSQPDPESPFQRIVTVLNDYRSGRYYRPWRTCPPIIVSTKKQIAELSGASALSQRAVYADLFGFKHTLNNLDHHERTNTRSRLSGRLVYVNGLTNLPELYSYLNQRLHTCLERHFESGNISSGLISLSIAQTTRNLTVQLMGLIFFGEKLSSEKKFGHAIGRYPMEMISCLVAFKLTPSWLSPLAHTIITRRGRSMHTIIERLSYIIGEGRTHWDEQPRLKELTFAWNMAKLAEGVEYWSGADHLAQSLLGIWFASIHQPWMNLHFVILELCLHKEWQNILRQEIGDFHVHNYDSLQGLPLLDAFIKESFRLHPLDSMCIRRKALKDYTFSSGFPSVPAGATVCSSSYDLMHDERDYPNANEFNPWRFVKGVSESTVSGSKLTEVSTKFPIWGYGSLACPGRFHASLVLKMVIARLVTRFDMSLENEKKRHLWSWETFTMPYESTRMTLKERA